MQVLLRASKRDAPQALGNLMRTGQVLAVRLPVVVFGVSRVKLFRPYKSIHANDAIVPPHRLAMVLRMLAENGLVRDKREADERWDVEVLLGSSSLSSSSSSKPSSSSVATAQERQEKRALQASP